ncbi:hypothetical protein SHL15_9037 [Streptomyces hygroscopicus subsp. limoneus]|nr:hypothetical protein SHL15_9037 [Streptomyces hygroscopicus subsp. limoneus]
MINGIAPDVRTHVGPPSDGRRARAGFWLAAAVYPLAVLGGTLPIPLYAFRAPRMGFGPFTTTPVFAAYAVGAVLALMLSVSLTDRAGRRPPAAALLAAATSTVLSLVAHVGPPSHHSRPAAQGGSALYVPPVRLPGHERAHAGPQGEPRRALNTVNIRFDRNACTRAPLWSCPPRSRAPPRPAHRTSTPDIDGGRP